MKGLFTLCFGIALLIASCQQKPAPKEAESHKAEPSPTITKTSSSLLLAEYEQFLKSLDSAKVENVSKAADKYATLFEGQPQSLADSGYVLFERFYLRVDNSINKVHANDTTDYFDPLVLEMKEPISKALLDYSKRMKANGFVVELQEGGTYLKQDRDFLERHFYIHISPVMKEYLVQLNRENKETFSGDGGIFINEIEFADRIIWWEVFIRQNPTFILLKESKERQKEYLTYFFEGMDNTPVVEPDYENNAEDEHTPEANKLNPYFKDAYQYLNKKAPISQANKLVKPYFQALQKGNMSTANKLLQQYRGQGFIMTWSEEGGAY